jgi:hypothetical protein
MTGIRYSSHTPRLPDAIFPSSAGFFSPHRASTCDDADCDIVIAAKLDWSQQRGFSNMKTILVLIGGGDRDQVVFETAMAAARPLSAHLDFLHVRVGAEEKARTFSEIAARNFRDFCLRWQIEVCDTPAGERHVTASYREVTGNSLERLTYHARHCDLVVMGRAKQKQGLPQNTLERLVLVCGRPMLVVATAAPQRLTGTIMVCWKESANAARAVAAAMPILTKAKRVVLTCVLEHDESGADAVKDLARQFAWNGATPIGRSCSCTSRLLKNSPGHDLRATIESRRPGA